MEWSGDLCFYGQTFKGYRGIRMTRKIITVIGGGSVTWMPGLMRDVYLLDEIEGGEIRLVDPDKTNVEAVAQMLHKFNEIRVKDYAISVVDDRKAALKDADFVLTTFSPGSMDAFYNDLEIPVKYGIRLPVSMTVGIPGISAAIRTVPVAYEIVKEMEEVCPGAWLLNVTNPMSCVTRAMNLAAEKIKVIGMCHEFHAFGAYAGPILGLNRPQGMDVLTYLYKWLPEQGLDYTVAGINHFVWLIKAVLNGEDVIPRIREFCEKNLDFDTEDPVLKTIGLAKMALCKQFGYMPLAGDRHLVEFYPSLCNIRNGFGMKFNVVKTTVDVRRHAKEYGLRHIRNIANGTAQVTWTRTGEEMTEIMRAIVTGCEVMAIVNMPNKGQISNMQKDVVVETLACVSKDGARPKMSGELPGAVGSLCRLHADIHEMTVKAALTGDRKLLVEAMSLDPSSGSACFAEIPKLCDELLRANKKWLPRFFV